MYTPRVPSVPGLSGLASGRGSLRAGRFQLPSPRGSPRAGGGAASSSVSSGPAYDDGTGRLPNGDGSGRQKEQYAFDRDMLSNDGALSGLHARVRYTLPRVEDRTGTSFSGTVAAMHGYTQPTRSQQVRETGQVYNCIARREPQAGVNTRHEVICAGTTAGQVILWRYPLPQRLGGLPPPVNTIAPALVIGSHRAAVTSMAFYDDAVLVTGSNDCSICLWDVHLQYISTEAPGFKGKSRCIQNLCAHDSSVSHVAVHGPWVVSSGSHDGTVKVWGSAPGREKLSFPFLIPLQVIVLESRITAMHCGELRAVEGVVPDLIIATADGNVTMFRSTEEALIATATASAASGLASSATLYAPTLNSMMSMQNSNNNDNRNNNASSANNLLASPTTPQLAGNSFLNALGLSGDDATTTAAASQQQGSKSNDGTNQSVTSSHDAAMETSSQRSHHQTNSSQQPPSSARQQALTNVAVFRVVKQVRTHYPDGAIPSVVDQQDQQHSGRVGGADGGERKMSGSARAGRRSSLRGAGSSGSFNSPAASVAGGGASGGGGDKNQTTHGSITSVVPLPELNTIMTLGFSASCLARDSLNFTVMNSVTHPDVNTLTAPGNPIRFTTCAYDSRKEELILLDSFGEIFVWSTKSARIVFRTNVLPGAFHAVAVGERGFWVVGRRDICLLRIDRDDHRLEHPVHNERVVFVGLAPEREWWGLVLPPAAEAAAAISSPNNNTDNNNHNNSDLINNLSKNNSVMGSSNTYEIDDKGNSQQDDDMVAEIKRRKAAEEEERKREHFFHLLARSQIEEITPWLVSASIDNTIRVFNSTMRCMHTMKERRSEIASFCILLTQPGFCVSGHEDGSVKVWALTAQAAKAMRTQSAAPALASLTSAAATELLSSTRGGGGGISAVAAMANATTDNSEIGGGTATSHQSLLASVVSSALPGANHGGGGGGDKTAAMANSNYVSAGEAFSHDTSSNAFHFSAHTNTVSVVGEGLHRRNPFDESRFDHHPHLFSCSYDGTLAVWSMPVLGGSRIKCEARVKCTDSEIVSARYDGVQKCYWIGTNRGEVTAWSLDELRPLRKLVAAASALSSSSSDPFGSGGGGRRGFQPFSTAGSSTLNSTTNNSNSNGNTASAQRLLDSLSDDNFDGTTTARLRQQQKQRRHHAKLQLTNLAHAEASTAIALDANYVFTGSEDGTIRMWNGVNGELHHSLQYDIYGVKTLEEVIQKKRKRGGLILSTGGMKSSFDVSSDEDDEDSTSSSGSDNDGGGGSPAGSNRTNNNNNRRGNNNNIYSGSTSTQIPPLDVEEEEQKRAKKRAPRRGAKLAGDVHFLFVEPELGHVVVGTRLGVVALFDQATGRAISIGTTNKATVKSRHAAALMLHQPQPTSVRSRQAASSARKSTTQKNDNVSSNEGNGSSSASTARGSGRGLAAIPAPPTSGRRAVAAPPAGGVEQQQQQEQAEREKRKAAASAQQIEQDFNDRISREVSCLTLCPKKRELIAGLGNGSIVRLSLQALKPVEKPPPPPPPPAPEEPEDEGADGDGDDDHIDETQLSEEMAQLLHSLSLSRRK